MPMLYLEPYEGRQYENEESAIQDLIANKTFWCEGLGRLITHFDLVRMFGRGWYLYIYICERKQIVRVTI